MSLHDLQAHRDALEASKTDEADIRLIEQHTIAVIDALRRQISKSEGYPPHYLLLLQLLQKAQKSKPE